MKCSIGDNISPRTAKGRFACEFLFKKIVLHMDTKAGMSGMNWEVGIDIYTLLTVCLDNE